MDRTEARQRLERLRVATDTTEREVDVSREAMFAARLKQIDDALTRLSSGTYGHCIVCNTAIPDERLRAIPDTPFCAKDAQREQARAQ